MTAPSGPLPIPDEVLALLRQVYTDTGCDIWWTRRNRNLGNMAPKNLWVMTSFDRAAVRDEALRLTGDLNG